MQLRSVIATLVTRSDISVGPKEDGLAVCRDMNDQFKQYSGSWIFIPSQGHSRKPCSGKIVGGPVLPNFIWS